MEADDTDVQMIEQLIEDGRQSFRDLADEIDVSPSTVSARMRKLEHEDIVDGFRPHLNYANLGFDLTAIVEASVSSDALAKGHDRLRELDNVISMYEVTGEQDLIMICKFRDREEMNEIVKQIIKLDCVESTHTRVALTAPKENAPLDLYELLLDDEDDTGDG